MRVERVGGDIRYDAGPEPGGCSCPRSASYRRILTSLIALTSMFSKEKYGGGFCAAETYDCGGGTTVGLGVSACGGRKKAAPVPAGAGPVPGGGTV